MSLIPLLTATPTTPPTYNVGIAETFSWVPVEGAGRPLYARATYLANPGDIKVSLSAGDINIGTAALEALVADSNTKLDALTSSANQIEGLIYDSTTRLDLLTAVDYATTAKQDTSNSLLEQLTAIQTDKQDQIITLLHSITGSTVNVELNTDQIELHVDGVETLLHDLTASNKNVPGFSVPPYDEITFSYVGSTDIFRTVTYLNNSTQVMALSFTYITEPPTTGNAIIQSVKKI